MLRPDIQDIGAKWIAELRLQDRIITIRYTVNLCDPLGNLVYGLMTILNLDEGRFLIEVRDPSTWPTGGSRALSSESIEEGIVHELVHIRWIDLTAHNPDPTALVQEERAAWATARALVRANSNTRAAIVRAMAAKQPAATRRQTKGKAMDAQAVIAALKEADGEAALKILGEYVAEQLGAGQPAPASVPEPMPQGAGDTDPEKDKMPMGYDPKMARTMKADLADVRAMKAELTEALNIVRPTAKVELVRAMRADGIVLTKAQEDMITSAPTIEVAKDRAATMCAMAPAGTRKDPAKPPGDDGGLTPEQATKYRGMVAANNPRAELYRDEAIRANAKAKKGGAK